eukprot:g4144.t1
MLKTPNVKRSSNCVDSRGFPTIERCVNCNSYRSIFEMRGDMVCRSCGLVHVGRVATPPKVDYTSPGTQNLLVDGATIFLQRRGLLKEESFTDIDLSTSTLPLRIKNSLVKGNKFFRRFCNAKDDSCFDGLQDHHRDRWLFYALTRLQPLCERLELSEALVGCAMRIFAQALDNRVCTRFDETDGYVAASLYSACRVMATPRTLFEICRCVLRTNDQIGFDPKVATKIYLKMKRELFIRTLPVPFHSFVRRFASKLNFPRCVSQAAESIALRLPNAAPELAGPNSCKELPIVAAAVCVFASVLTLSPVTTENAAAVLLFPELSILNVLKEMLCRRVVKALLPSKLLEKLENDGLDSRRLVGFDNFIDNKIKGKEREKKEKRQKQRLEKRQLLEGNRKDDIKMKEESSQTTVIDEDRVEESRTKEENTEIDCPILFSKSRKKLKKKSKSKKPSKKKKSKEKKSEKKKTKEKKLGKKKRSKEERSEKKKRSKLKKEKKSKSKLKKRKIRDGDAETSSKKRLVCR